MLSEVVNALFFTYIGTEYLLDCNSVSPKRVTQLFRTKAFTLVVFLVICINVIDRVTGAADVLNNLLQGFLHLPRIVLAALAYIVALYFDCRRVAPVLKVKTFLPLVGKAFLRVLPAYPFLAVIISFGFMVLINIFETFHIPLEYLNSPIYYGTLYGPFSFVYWKVKEKVVDDGLNTLPRTTPW